MLVEMLIPGTTEGAARTRPTSKENDFLWATATSGGPIHRSGGSRLGLLQGRWDELQVGDSRCHYHPAEGGSVGPLSGKCLSLSSRSCWDNSNLS